MDGVRELKHSAKLNIQLGRLTLRLLNHPVSLHLLHCFGFPRATSSKNL